VKYPSKAKLEALESLMLENAALFHRLRTVSEEIHGPENVTPGMRGVMTLLEEGGPQTVPRLARIRGVSRQHIQILVNRLLEEKMVELASNPAHRRSRLVALTGTGQNELAVLKERERDLLSQLPVGISKKDLRNAAGTLRSARKLFESDHWSWLTQGRVEPS